ncbi:MAG: hypothetical protein EA367_05005 [Leptolyngbya sp. DLM2.Bin15]|nr:MAG: hypothetical protein EA367_05005 [Leptolyngbya sp. DLM2.Bin15]
MRIPFFTFMTPLSVLATLALVAPVQGTAPAKLERSPLAFDGPTVGQVVAASQGRLSSLSIPIPHRATSGRAIALEADLRKQGDSGTTAVFIDQQGSLDDDDEPSPVEGGVYDVYSFVGRAGQSVSLNLNSNDFDPYLILIGPDGTLVDENDDISPTNLNSAINTTLPSNGNYLIVVTSYAPQERGTYQLRATTTLGTGDLQATLRWDSPHDLDLAVMDPTGEVVAFNNTPVASGGQLDVDAHALCERITSAPVENIFWPAGQAPAGEYVIAVSLYARCDESVGPIPFTLNLTVQGSTETLTGVVDETNDLVTFTTAVY